MTVWFFSDLKVKVAGEKLNAHKFVLAARSDVWSLANMASTSELDLSGEQTWCDTGVLKEMYCIYKHTPLSVNIGVNRWLNFHVGVCISR